MGYSPDQLAAPETGSQHNDLSDLQWFLVHGFDELQNARPKRNRQLTKSQRAYAALRRAIVTHALPSGLPLDEVLLQERFPCGRTPLREALKQLSYEGLLIWPPRQAPAIRDIGLHEMRYLYETRQMIEPELASLAAQRASNHHKAAMSKIMERLVEASRAGFVYESVELDYALHAAIAQASHNRFLAEANDNLNLQSLRLWFRAQRALGVESIHHSHSDLVESICGGDVETARSLAQSHIDASWERQRVLLESDSRAIVSPPFFSPDGKSSS